MASAVPSPTPNPDAMKFTLDTTLPGAINIKTPEAAKDNPFAAAIFSIEGVKSLFGINDFITVTRQPGVEWGPIVAGVEKAAAEHL